MVNNDTGKKTHFRPCSLKFRTVDDIDILGTICILSNRKPHKVCYSCQSLLSSSFIWASSPKFINQWCIIYHQN